MSTTLALDDDYDLDIQNNNFVVITGIDALRQRLRMNLSTFLGEWYLDPDLGMPYFSQVFKKNVSIGTLNSIFRQEITATEGVKSLNSINFTQELATRTLLVSFNVTASDGTVLEDNVAVGA